MRILHLISSGGFYGAETMVLNLASAQAKLDNQVALGVFHNKHQPHLELAAEARRRGVAVKVFACNGRFDRAVFRDIREFMTANAIDVVHGHGYKSDFYGYFVARKLGTPLVSTCHLWTRATRTLRFYEFIDSLVLRRARRVAGVSDAITEALQRAGVPRSKLSTVFNGTDLMRFKTASSGLRDELEIADRPLIGTAGRLETQKGIEYFLQAAQGVVRVFPDAFFVIAGDGSLKPALARLISQLQLDAHVRLLGERTDMPAVYASLDLFVLASIDEGMPMTVLEALAAGRPVIATRVGAVGKLILPARTGLLVEARDVPALRDAILLCLRNPSFARELGSNGEQHVRQSFSAEAMARNYMEIYRQAVHEQAQAAVHAAQRS